jgi:DNA-directed RNA polymerase specialized sigma24 family protein
MARFHAFINAYRKDNASYTYWQDDGTEVTLVAGQDGVTEEWIARLKVWHREERSSMRHGEDLVVSLEALCEEMDDHSEVLKDMSGDPAERMVVRIEWEMQRKMLRQILKQLTPGQMKLLIQITVRGESFASIAREEGVSEAAVRKRLKKIMLSIGETAI